MTRIALVGGGQMGEALLAGIIKAGISAESIAVVESSEVRAKELVARYGVRTPDLAAAVDGADYIFVAVKPKDVPAVAGDIAQVLTDSEADTDSTIVSIAAGVTTAYLESLLTAGHAVIRVMPNTPLLVGEGVCAVSAGRYAREEHVDTVCELLGAVGTVLRVPESDMDLVTAVSGSGPAYYFLIVEAMVEAAVSLGLTRPVATQLAIGTIKGSAVMLEESGKTAVELREAVTSPGGTTAAGLRAFEDGGLRSTIYQVLEDVAAKSAELRPKAANGASSHN